MKHHIIPALLVFMLVALLLQACNYPGATPPTPFVFPTPDLTLTAIFSTLASPTPPVVQTATDVPPPPTLTPTSSPQVTTAPVFPTATSATGSIPPTNTPPVIGPVNTATSPPPTPTRAARAGTSVKATFLPNSPTIDGSLGEWRLTRYPVDNVTFGRDLWDNREDLSGEFMIGWDDNYLYIAAEVTDEDYIQLAALENIYQGDSLEILLDTELARDFNSSELSGDDYQIGISPGSPAPGEDAEAYRWFPREREDTLPQVLIAARRTGDGYDVEAAVPWNYFGVDAETGARYGFVFSVSDNDRNGTITQQSMISNVSVRRLTNPTSWGELELVRP